MPSKQIVFILTLLAGALAASPPQSALPVVELKRVPEGGIQPQVAVAEDGTVHLVYFKGDPLGGDLFYVHSGDGESFSAPIRVNSVPGSAVAVGNIRGARIAAGRAGSVYVVWNGSDNAAHSNGGRTPMVFTRLNKSRAAFERERNLIHTAYGLDGGGGLATDRAGRVFVLWHAPMPGGKDEEARRVWMTRSVDDGDTFEPERVAWKEPTGACGCCSLNAFADESGRLFVLFRSAHEMVHRDMYLLRSDDHGNTFAGADISPWQVGVCVMSSEAFAVGANGVLAAWETEKRVHFGRIGNEGLKVSDAVAGGNGHEKYPSLAEDRNGLTLVSWTEDMGWKRGGSLHWNLFDRSGQQVGAAGATDGVPAWSLVASYARHNGGFTILY